MLNYNHLYYFHVAATQASLAGAAERLGVTQPTVSEQIRTLERTLGVTLFERTAAGLTLTDAGRLAYDHTSVMFRAGERLVEALGQDEVDLPRTLRVGLASSVARATTTSFLLPLLALDDCVPVIRSGDTAALLRELRGSELDLVLCESEPPEASRKDLELVQVERTTLVAVAPPDLVPRHDWEDVAIVQYRASSALRWVVESYLDEHALHPRVAAEADDALFLVEAAARAGHVAFVPRSVARDAVANGRLKVIADLPPDHAGVWALYAQTATAELARRAVEVLIDRAHADQR